jgi:hypothetical protein
LEHPWSRAIVKLVARQHPPPGLSPDQPVDAVRNVLDSIGDTCPECPPE